MSNYTKNGIRNLDAIGSKDHHNKLERGHVCSRPELHRWFNTGRQIKDDGTPLREQACRLCDVKRWVEGAINPNGGT